MARLARLLPLVAVLWLGCQGRSATGIGLMDRPGQYVAAGGAYVIEVTKNANALITYSVADRHGVPALTCQRQFSAYQRWFLYWDEEERLWVHSSDIGAEVWFRDTTGHYVAASLSESSPWIDRIPEVFYSQLPSRIKLRWDRLRKRGGAEDNSVEPRQSNAST